MAFGWHFVIHANIGSHIPSIQTGIVTGGADGSIKLWDMRNLKVKRCWQFEYSLRCTHYFWAQREVLATNAHTGPVSAVMLTSHVGILCFRFVWWRM